MFDLEIRNQPISFDDFPLVGVFLDTKNFVIIAFLGLLLKLLHSLQTILGSLEGIINFQRLEIKYKINFCCKQIFYGKFDYLRVIMLSFIKHIECDVDFGSVT